MSSRKQKRGWARIAAVAVASAFLFEGLALGAIPALSGDVGVTLGATPAYAATMYEASGFALSQSNGDALDATTNVLTSTDSSGNATVYAAANQQIYIAFKVTNESDPAFFLRNVKLHIGDEEYDASYSLHYGGFIATLKSDNGTTETVDLTQPWSVTCSGSQTIQVADGALDNLKVDVNGISNTIRTVTFLDTSTAPTASLIGNLQDGSQADWDSLSTASSVASNDDRYSVAVSDPLMDTLRSTSAASSIQLGLSMQKTGDPAPTTTAANIDNLVPGSTASTVVNGKWILPDSAMQNLSGGAASEEGTYSVEVSYNRDTVLAGYYGFGSSSRSSRATVQLLVDQTAPEFSRVVVHSSSDSSVLQLLTSSTFGQLLVDPNDGIDQINFTLDASKSATSGTGTSVATSGIDDTTVKVNYKALDTDGTVIATKTVEANPSSTAGEYYITLDSLPEGVYRISDFTVYAYDEAGNPVGDSVDGVSTSTASCHVNSVDGVCSSIAVSHSLSSDSLGIDLDVSRTWTSIGQSSTSTVEMTRPTQEERDNLQRGVHTDTVVTDPWITDVLFRIFNNMTPHSTSTTSGIPASMDALLYDGTTAGGFDPNAASGLIPTLSFGTRPTSGYTYNGTYDVSFFEGLYQLTLDYRGQSETKYFAVDATAPQITGVSTEATTLGPHADQYVPDGTYTDQTDGSTHTVRDLLGGKRTLTINVKDLLNNAENVTVGSATYPLVSGVASVQVSYTYQPYNSTEMVSKDDTLTPVDDDGNYQIQLDRSGVYDFTNASFVLTDKVGNTTTLSYTDLVSNGMTLTIGSTTGDLPGKFYVVDPTYDAPTVTVTDDDVKGAPAASHEHYHRGGITLNVTVTDALLPVYERLGGYNLASLSYTITSSGEEPKTYTVPTSGLTDNGNGSYSYELQAEGEEPTEGLYSVTASYEWWGGKVTGTPASFTADHNGPESGDVNVTPGGQMHYGMLFVDSDATVDVPVTDNQSGMDSQTYAATVSGGTVASSYVGSDGDLTDIMRLQVTGDASRLEFDGTAESVSDMAGNPVTTISLADKVKAGQSNVDKDVTAVVVDTVAPEISLSYDNNDVRNGHYYNQGRTATLTLTESNFGYVVQNDPNTLIGTATVDGSARQITAQDFTNPSGDGTTWVAAIDMTTDGDWTIQAQYTDLVGHASNQVSDSFTVDTEAPIIMVTFDNNDEHNGMYYNAPCTATVEVDERNFTEDAVSVATTAADASGASVAAPGMTGWRQGSSEAGEQYGWQTSVYFGGELHYTMSINAMDLAGNAATVYEVPEFVIDMTLPQVSITDVADRTAYAGTIAPKASMTDTNYDMAESEYTLVGAHSGEVNYMDGEQTSYNDTGMSVDYSDFERTVDTDDVYTMTAHAVDLAGNTVDKSVTFSVSRFGSNYVYSDNTAALRGTYVNSAPTIVVSEINVSGLDDSKTHVELVEDNDVKTLAAGTDYMADKSDDAGWSETTYTIPSSNFADDAYYRVLLTSKDLAGNLSQNTMDDKDADRSGVASISFAVDRTAPSVGFTGVEANNVYFGPAREAGPRAEDNLALQSETVSLDGQVVATYDAEQIASGQATLQVPADAAYHSVTITATDMAGNTSSVTYSLVAVAANWWEFLMANPRVLFLVVTIGVLVTGAIGVTVALAVRHHRRTEQLRNPFGH
jgi:hypothetical protein